MLYKGLQAMKFTQRIAFTRFIPSVRILGQIGLVLSALISMSTYADDTAKAVKTSAGVGVSDDLEGLKKSLLKLKRDLVILEEDLLFPASSQVAVYLSMDVGDLFSLDAVTLKLNGKNVHHHLYTEKQVDALYRGGVQKLFVGNVKQGKNRVTAFFTGRGPNGRDYRRAATIDFEKSFEPTFVELAIADSEANYQPEFSASLSE